MTTKEADTDPSTPAAMRSGDTDPSPAPTPGKKDTHRGLGTPPPPAAQSEPPAAAAPRPQPSNNSVDMLLEGIAGPQPERVKMTPQSAGQASASYHASHALKPARTDPDGSEPKVVVERPKQAATVRIDRSNLDRVPDVPSISDVEQPAEARPRRPLEATFLVPPKPKTGPRVVIASVAGVVVVIAIFVAIRLATSKETAATTATQGPSIPPNAPLIVATAVQAMPAPPAATSAAAEDTSATAAATSATSSAPPIALKTGPKPKATGPAAPPAATPAPAGSGGDLGEFKTTFH